MKPAGRAPEPAGRAKDTRKRASETAGRASQPAGMVLEPGRPGGTETKTKTVIVPYGVTPQKGA